MDIRFEQLQGLALPARSWIASQMQASARCSGGHVSDVLLTQSGTRFPRLGRSQAEQAEEFVFG
jgi:hypothetical protein